MVGPRLWDFSRRVFVDDRRPTEIYRDQTDDYGRFCAEVCNRKDVLVAITALEALGK